MSDAGGSAAPLPGLVELYLWELISNAGLQWSIRRLVVVVAAVTMSAAVFVIASGAACVWLFDSQGLLDEAVSLLLTAGLLLTLGAGISRATASLMRASPLTRPSTRTAMLRTWRVPPQHYGLVWTGVEKVPAGVVMSCFVMGIGGAYLTVSGDSPALVLLALAATALNPALVPIAADLLIATSGRGCDVGSRSIARWPLVGLCLGMALATAYLGLRSWGVADLGLKMVCLGNLAITAAALSMLVETTRQPRIDRLYRDRTSARARRLRIVWLERAAPEPLVLLHHLRRSKGYLAPTKLALLTALGLSVVLVASTFGLDVATWANSQRGTLALAGVCAMLSLVAAETTMAIWPTRQLTARLRLVGTPERERRGPAVVLACYALLASPLALVLGVAALAMRPELWAFGLGMPLVAVAGAVLLHCLSEPAIQPGGAEILDVVSGTALAALSYVPLALVAFTGRAADVLMLGYIAILSGGASACLGRLLRVRPSSSRAWWSATNRRPR